MKDYKERQRHPSTSIPPDVIAEATYRWYLRLLEPPMTPEESQGKTTTIHARGRDIVQDDAHRRRCSVVYQTRMREALRVLVDMGMVQP